MTPFAELLDRFAALARSPAPDCEGALDVLARHARAAAALYVLEADRLAAPDSGRLARLVAAHGQAPAGFSLTRADWRALQQGPARLDNGLAAAAVHRRGEAVGLLALAGGEALPDLPVLAALAAPCLPETESLDQGPRRLERAIEHMPVLVEATAEDGRLVFWNRECERVTGYTAAEMLDNPQAWETLYPEDAERAEASRELGLSGLERVMVCKDGERRLIAWAEVGGRPPVPGWARWSVGVDITRRALVERQVERAKREWEGTFDSVTDCIAILDLDFRVKRVNTSLARRLDAHPGDLVGKPFRQLVEEDGDAANIASVVRFMAEMDDEVTMKELAIRKLGGLFLVTVCPYRVGTDERVGAIFVAHDISRWKELEEQLNQAQKMEALGALAGGIAHDFNNILGVILGYGEMVLDGMEPDDRRRSKVEEIVKAGERARDLTAQILAFSRQDRDKPRPLRLAPLVKETVRLIKATAPPEITVAQHLLTREDRVLADPTHIHRILMNLGANAVQAVAQAMEEGRLAKGLVEVSLAEVVLADPEEAGLPHLAPGPYARLTVRDNGPGVPRDLACRVFDPFFTTKPPGAGTGMGLSVVHGIVQKLGGAVVLAQDENGRPSAASTPEHGAAFHVYLPRTEPLPNISRAPAPGDAGVDMGVGVPLGSERVLLVDDEPALAALGKEMLEGLGYRVAAFTNPTRALERFAEDPAAFDVCVTDMRMPRLDGVSLARELLALRPGFPVILCTGFSETVAYEEATKLGVAGFIVKPVLKERMAAMLREVLRG